MNIAFTEAAVALPAELANFVRTKSAAYLQLSAGVAAQATGPLPSDLARWRELAEALAEDPEAARDLLLWLSAQQQPNAYLALAAYWGELVRIGADVDGKQPVQGVSPAGMRVDASDQMLSNLARLAVIPEAVLQDFHSRLRAGEISYSSLIAAASRAVDEAEARMLLALGGANAPLDVVFSSSRPADGRTGLLAAIELAAEQPDPAIIDRLLAQTTSGNAGLALIVATKWAGHHLSGERLAHLEQLVRAGAFVGAVQQQMLSALLANAEDRESAAALAASAGIALPAAMATPN